MNLTALTILIIIIVLLFLYRLYKKAEDYMERTLFILMVIVCFVPVGIYYLDSFNVPTVMKWTENLDSQNWLSFLANYTSSIISAIIGGVITMIVTIIQIQRNNEDSEKRDKENLRFQNLPILKYTFDTKQDVPIEIENLIVTNIEGTKTYKLTVGIKNIGLNSIKSIKADMNILELNLHESLLGKKSLEVLEKSDEVFIKRFFTLEGDNKKYNFELTVLYEDLLNNWYKQIINVQYVATDYCDRGEYVGNIEYTIGEAELLIENNK